MIKAIGNINVIESICKDTKSGYWTSYPIYSGDIQDTYYEINICTEPEQGIYFTVVNTATENTTTITKSNHTDVICDLDSELQSKLKVYIDILKCLDYDFN
jgi:hypothetical protein